MTTKILLDTDIGSDIDDAVCLAYLLAQPECELLGITTVSGEAEKRAMLASVLCKVAGKDIPIYPGNEAPLIVAQRQVAAQQAAALERWPHQESFERGRAVDFLRETIRNNPGEVTLLAIGPLTNVALLFALDPEIPGLLKSLVVMCGTFESCWGRRDGHLEWNALLDPHATAIVYASRPPLHRSIGLDVTDRVRMSRDEVCQRFSHPLLVPVVDFAQVWFAQTAEITFHDPLAATTIFDEEVCTFYRGKVDVEISSQRAAGMTYWERDESGPHEVALDVDQERFFRHYFSVFE